MKNPSLIFLLPLLMLFFTGCTSNITAKYDDYNETFSGKTHYNAFAVRATIDVVSDKNGAICFGNASMYAYPIWQFKLNCSDGRAIKGLLKSANLEGRAFTSRNEIITFSVAKTQKTINSMKQKYNLQIKDKPLLDNKKELMQVYL